MSSLTSPAGPSPLGRRRAWFVGLGLVGMVGLGWALLAASGLLSAPARPVAGGLATVAPAVAARATPRPATIPPGEVASRYLARWMAGDYDSMYDLLTPAAQRRLDRQAFGDRYRAIADEAMILRLRASLPPGVNSLAPLQPFTVTFETARAGAFSEQNQLPLSLVDGRWGIDWQPSLILCDLQPGDRVRLLTETPTRGRILDRHGEILAYQGEIATIGVVPNEVDDPAALVKDLAAALDLDPADLRQTIAASPPDWFVPVARRPWRAPPPALARLAERPGVDVRVALERVYPLGAVAAHVVGYVSEVGPEEARDQRARGYRPGEWVGRAGVEAAAEAILAGERGGRLTIVAPDGATRRVLTERRATPARDVYLTLDLLLQRRAEAALGDRSGALVGLDPASGAVRVLVSRPAVDPNLFVIGQPAALAAVLGNERARPLVNRATAEGVPPGSTFKVVTMAAAMESLRLAADTPLDCPATFSLPGRPEVWRDWQPGGQGRLTLQAGLVHSCNTIFYALGQRLDGRDPRLLPEMARRFGFGQATGLGDLPEAPGLVPDPAWKQTTLGDAWATGDAINLAIGQGALLVTPLQVARAYAAIANGGTLWTPYLIETPRPVERVAAPHHLRLAPGTLTALRAALAEVPSRLMGPTYTAFDGYRGPAVAGKTGTAETGGGGVTHAWFAAYAPAAKADLAVVVLVERGGEGALVAAPIARAVLEPIHGPTTLAWQTDGGTGQSGGRTSH